VSMLPGVTPRRWHGCGRSRHKTNAANTSQYTNATSDGPLECHTGRALGCKAGGAGAQVPASILRNSAPGRMYHAEPTAMFSLRMLSTAPGLPDVYRYDMFDYGRTHTIV